MSRYQAPSVSYPVGPCFWYRRLLVSAWLLGACLVLGAWALAGAAPHGVALLGLVVTAGVGAWAWRFSPRGQLGWQQGVGWFWHGGRGSVELPRPRLAWQGRDLMLLQLHGAPLPLRWMWVERWREPQRWDALCRAVFAT